MAVACTVFWSSPLSGHTMYVDAKCIEVNQRGLHKAAPHRTSTDFSKQKNRNKAANRGFISGSIPNMNTYTKSLLKCHRSSHPYGPGTGWLQLLRHYSFVTRAMHPFSMFLCTNMTNWVVHGADTECPKRHMTAHGYATI
jgi:hypothetical protein